MPSQSALAIDPCAVSHNLMGQRLGRKGQETRERILAAFGRLLVEPTSAPLTLSGVAREASMGMSTLYLYFPDLGALVYAGLRGIMESERIEFVHMLQERWPDEDLATICLAFTQDYHHFWRKHGRILHLRNSLADSNDPRFLELRHKTSMPLVQMLAWQMDADPSVKDGFAMHFAMVLLTSVERICTVVTNPYFPFDDDKVAEPQLAPVDELIAAEAKLIEVAIRHQRQANTRAVQPAA